jgi:hypothetical protein
VNEAEDSIEAIYVDRYGFIRSIDEHLSSYVARLRDPAQADLQATFETAWTLVHQ